MSNLMTKLYIAYVVDIIYENGKPNFNLRVRVPSIHGASNATGINDADLPIAKPLFSPGVGYNQSLLEETLQNVNKVYVIFESGNYSKPVYLGLKNDETLNAIPSNVSQIFFYEQKEQFPTLGNPTYIYWAQNLDILYYWEWTDEAETFGDYKPFAGSGLEFTIDDLSSGETPAQYVLASDGQGGVVWQLRGNRNFVYPENETPESQGNQIIIGDLWFEYK
jgi:hypothetical protein